MPYISGGGGGGPAAGTYLPVADTTGVTVNTTTYNNTITGSGKLTTLVFPAETGAVALAISGDLFPRLVLQTDGFDTLCMGDGTVDPTAHGAIVGTGSPNGDGTMVAAVFGDLGSLRIGQKSTNVALFDSVGDPLRISANVSGATISSGANAPTIGGNVGDLFIRTNPANDASYLYRCTTAGTAGNAVWAAITGA